MDQGVREPEKPRSVAGDSDRRFSEIVCRPIDWQNHNEVMHVAELYWLFCKQVNDEDVSNLREFTMPDGSKVQMIEAEARLYGYKAAGAEIHLAFVGELLAGFLICSVVFERILAIRCLYSEPWTQGLKLGSGLVQSVQPTPHTVIFQARKAAPPERTLEITRSYSPRIIVEDEFFVTYSMKWGRDGAKQPKQPATS